MRLQVALEIEGLMLVGKRQLGPESPRREFRGVRAAARIVGGQSLAEIGRETNVGLVAMRFAAQEVDVIHAPTAGRAAVGREHAFTPNSRIGPASPVGLRRAPRVALWLRTR